MFLDSCLERATPMLIKRNDTVEIEFIFLLTKRYQHFAKRIILLQVTQLQWRRCVSSDYGIRGMGVRADPGSFRWCQALSRSRSFATTLNSCIISILLLLTSTTNANNPLPGKSKYDKTVLPLSHFLSHYYLSLTIKMARLANVSSSI